PRSSRTRSRIASSSDPKDSICLSVRRISLFFVSVAIALSLVEVGSELDDDVAKRCRDADLDLLVLAGGDLAGRQVLHGARRLPAVAGVADAHPAAGGGGQSGILGLLEQRGAAVLESKVRGGEVDLAAGDAAVGDERRRQEALHVQPGLDLLGRPEL